MKGRVQPPRTRRRRPLGTAVKKPKDEARGKASELSVVPKDAFYAASRAKWRNWLSKNFKSKSYVAWKMADVGGFPWPLENTTSNSLRIKFLLLVKLVGVLVLINLPTDFEVWLVVPKKISKLPSVGYNDAVEDLWTLG